MRFQSIGCRIALSVGLAAGVVAFASDVRGQTPLGSTSFEGEGYLTGFLPDVVGLPLPTLPDPNGWADPWEALGTRGHDNGVEIPAPGPQTPVTPRIDGPPALGYTPFDPADGEFMLRLHSRQDTLRAGVKRDIPAGAKTAKAFTVTWNWRVQSVRHNTATPMDGRSLDVNGTTIEINEFGDAHFAIGGDGMTVARWDEYGVENRGDGAVFDVILKQWGELKLNEQQVGRWDGNDPNEGDRVTVEFPNQNILSTEETQHGPLVDQWGEFEVTVDNVNKLAGLKFNGEYLGGWASFNDPLAMPDELAVEAGNVWFQTNNNGVYVDNVRFESAFVLGDMAGDDDVDFDDIEPFVLGLTDAGEYQNQFGTLPEAKGDTDHDGDFDFDDIPGFVGLLVGGGPPTGLQAVPEPSTGLGLVLGLVACLGYSRWRRGGERRERFEKG